MNWFRISRWDMLDNSDTVAVKLNDEVMAEMCNL